MQCFWRRSLKFTFFVYVRPLFVDDEKRHGVHRRQIPASCYKRAHAQNARFSLAWLLAQQRTARVLSELSNDIFTIHTLLLQHVLKSNEENKNNRSDSNLTKALRKTHSIRHRLLRSLLLVTGNFTHYEFSSVSFRNKVDIFNFLHFKTFKIRMRANGRARFLDRLC